MGDVERTGIDKVMSKKYTKYDYMGTHKVGTPACKMFETLQRLELCNVYFLWDTEGESEMWGVGQ